MTQPILEPSYWRGRLEAAAQLHHAIFKCPLEKWLAVEAKHRTILAKHIQPHDSVLDAGCGYGRLLSLMPSLWHGKYYGVDISPDFVELARKTYPKQSEQFFVGDLRDLHQFSDAQFDWAVLISVRPMVKRNLGDDVWFAMEAELRRCAKKLLYLEYDENDEGSVE